MLAARLRSLRKEKRMTQEQIGKAIGISRDRYKSYENEQAEPPREILLKLADFHETTVEYIMGRTDKRGKEIKYDEGKKPSDLKKIIKETALTWDGKPITAEQANTLIAFYERLLELNKEKK